MPNVALMSVIVLSVEMPNVVNYDDCRNAECSYAQCPQAECHIAECRNANYIYDECHIAECRNAECYAECH
jgi:hypothetical protein